MASNILVSGSLAYDHLMKYDGLFEESFKADSLSNLSVSFQAKEHRVEFGGTAGNIAYGLKLLGANPLLFGVAGSDFAMYFDWLERYGIAAGSIKVDDDLPSAAAYILSDKVGAQISSFSLGAMQNSVLCMGFSAEDLTEVEVGDVALAIVSPDLPDRMLAFARSCVELGVDFIFDPGQAVTALSVEALEEMIASAKGLILNEYEAGLLCEKLEVELEDLSEKMDFVLRTMGAEGVDIFPGAERIAAVAGVEAVDVTGAGDAFRAGLLLKLAEGAGLEEASKYAAVLASFCVEHFGTQGYQFEANEFERRLSTLA